MTNQKTPQELFYGNIEFAYWMVRKFLNLFSSDPAFSFEDIAQLSLIGLWKAAREFDENKGTKFSSFAFRVIQNEILIGARAIKKTYKNNLLYFDDVFCSDSMQGKTIPFLNMIENTGKQPDEIVEQREYLRKILKAIPYLNKIEKKVIIFKLCHPDANQEEIGKALGLSQSYVSRIISRSVRYLQNFAESPLPMAGEKKEKKKGGRRI